MTTIQKEARISSRINGKLKAESEAVLSRLGITPTQAITMFYTQIAERKEFPLELKIPNNETIAALNEDLTHAKSYGSVDKLFEDLNS